MKRTNQPRNMIAKYAGKCACCGADIKVGEYITWYPSRREIAHVGGLDGNSARCASNIAAAMCPDPGELAADRWNERQADRVDGYDRDDLGLSPDW